MPWFNCVNITGTSTHWINVVVPSGMSITNYFPSLANPIQTTAISNSSIYGEWLLQGDMSTVPTIRTQESSRLVRSPSRSEYAATPGLNLAQDRARELLLSHLNEEQRSHYNEHRWFMVLGSRTLRRYRIEIHHLVANVRRIDDGARLCAHCNDNLPIFDHLLAQKLMIESDEDAFLAIANRHS